MRWESVHEPRERSRPLRRRAVERRERGVLRELAQALGTAQ